MTFGLLLKGSPTECQYALTSYGISNLLLPLDAEGKFVKAWIERYIDERILIEKEKGSPSLTMDSSRRIQNPVREDVLLGIGSSRRIQNPVPEDVLFGRGRPFQAWNSHLAELIEKHKHEYQACSRSEKTYLAKRLVKMIKSKGGRFLQRSEDENGWVEVSVSVAREKVSSGFRTIIKSKGSK